jgi:sec-independent protein translocase protein TatC
MPRPCRVEPEDELSLTEHLDELRMRMIVIVVAIVAAVAASFWQWRSILHWAGQPAEAALRPYHKPGWHLHFIMFSPTDAFFTAMGLSLDVAVLVTIPILAYQAYAFVIPAFSREHHKRIRALALMIPSLFVLGAVFAWVLVIPPALSFLLTFGGSGFNIQLRAGQYLQFLTMTAVAMGVIFEMPAIMYTLAKIRVVSARMMRDTWRYAVVALAVVAGVLPGADPISFVAEFVPLLALYALSYLIVWAVDRNREQSPRQARWDG